MKTRRPGLVCLWSSLALGVAAACSNAPREAPAPAATAESPVAITEKWRAKHETDYRREWVTIAGLYPLRSGTTSAGSAGANDVVLPPSVPARLGQFVRTDRAVRFEPAPGVDVRLKNREKDQPVTAPVELRDDSAPGADELVIGDVRLVVHVSGETRSLRVRDPNGAQAKGFLGFTWFPIDLQYRVVGRFIADPQPQQIKVLNTFGELDEYKSEGVVEFTLLGQTLRLRPFTTRPKRFYFVFKDASSGAETYEAARFLYADLLDDGTTVLDFNQAYNPPCAFNPYTTCPIPVRENRLPIKVLAGEKAYPVHTPLGPPANEAK
jgi:uncharacterized protein (DUF1684 family)